MSLTNYKHRLRTGVLEFLWRQWAQLGAAGHIEHHDTWIIDPEALLLLTLEFGRYDARLFDAVTDWTMDHRHDVSIHRLKSLSSGPIAIDTGILAAFAAVVDTYDTKHRWHTLATQQSVHSDEITSLFETVDGTALPLVGEPDAHFNAHGWLREKWQHRATSSRCAVWSSACLILSLRCLFGLSPRVEVIAYILTHGSARQRVIASAIGYSAPSVQVILADMVSAGYVHVSSAGMYYLDTLRWRKFLHIDISLLRWIQWSRVFNALHVLNEHTCLVESNQLSDYLTKSKTLSVISVVRDLLADSGMNNPFMEPCTLDNALDQLHSRTDALMSELNTGGEPIVRPA